MELNIYNWEDYFRETTLEDFEVETGIKVNLYTFEDEDFMLADVISNVDKYDVIIASGYLIRDMYKMKYFPAMKNQ